MCNSPCESAVSQFNLATDFAAKAVTMHALVYGGHIEYEINNDIKVEMGRGVQLRFSNVPLQ